MVGLALSLLISVGTVLELQDVPWTGMQFNPGSPPGGEERQAIHAIAALRPGGVTQVVPGAPADDAGIRIGDRILNVEEIPAYRVVRLRELSETLRVGYSVDFQIERQGEILDVPLVLGEPLRSTGYLVGLISGFVGALIFGAIGAVVVVKRPNDPRASLFFVMNVVFAAGYLLFSSVSSMAYGGLGMTDPEGWGARYWIVLGIYLVAGLLLGPLLLHFVLVFPKERPVLRNRVPVLGWIYSLAFLHFILAPIGMAYYWFRNRLPGSWNPDPIALVGLVAALVFIAGDFRRSARQRGWSAAVRDKPLAGMTFLVVGVLALLLAGDLATTLLVSDSATREVLRITTLLIVGMGSLMIIALVYPIATCVALRRSYREADAEERAQVRWPTWGTITALVGVSILALAAFGSSFLGTGNVSYLWLDFAQKLLYLLIPISFAFAILKYRLMDIELILRKAAVYSIFTGLVLVFYLALAGGLGGLLVRFLGIKSQWVLVIAVLIAGAVLVPVRNRIQGFVDRRFFRSRFDYPETLRNLTTALRAMGDLRAIARVTAEQVQEAVRSRAVVVFVRQRGRGTLKAAAKIGLPDETIERLEIPVGIEALKSGGPILETERLPAPLRRVARAEWVVPVRRGGELLGAITLGRKLSASGFDDDDREFCTSVADQVAVALENVLLRERGHEFDRALEIQRHLLPKSLPRIAGYELAARWQPSATVGGDYYDVIDLGGDRFGLCIADATGKGMPAALLMSNLQAAVRALAPGTDSPAELCRLINEILCGSGSASAFVSFFYGVLEARNGSLRYSNAGHNHPILLRRDGAVERLGVGGLVLGAFPDREYGEAELRFAPGDRLLLFTDGITEAWRADEEMFGEERLLDVLRRGARRSSPPRRFAQPARGAPRLQRDGSMPRVRAASSRRSP
jgi:hypothetical protein